MRMQALHFCNEKQEEEICVLLDLFVACDLTAKHFILQQIDHKQNILSCSRSLFWFCYRKDSTNMGMEVLDSTSQISIKDINGTIAEQSSD